MLKLSYFGRQLMQMKKFVHHSIIIDICKLMGAVMLATAFGLVLAM